VAANLTQAEANRLLDLTIVSGSVFLALTSTVPAATAAGTELSGNGYARQAITAATAAAAGSKANTAQILFPTVTTADWATILGFEVWDAATAGNRRWWRALSAAEQRTPKVGDQFRVATGALTWTLT
jgi:hypothetical protein